MREIKFRAWLNDQFIGHREVIERAHLIHSDSLNQDNLMQYTGLKDKNGVEIYEGDIVEVTQEDLFMGGFYTKVKEIAWGPKGGWHPMGTHCDNLSEYLLNTAGKNCSKVVGNIYENKNLLK